MRERGVDASSVPLIRILPVADPQPLRTAWSELSTHRLVVFVSPNAAWQFFAERPASAVWPAALLAGSPGPGTTTALAALGVPSACIVEPAADAPQLDSEALWAQLSVRPWQGARVLFVRGQGGREWLADQLRHHGASVVPLAAYRRAAPQLSADELVVARTALAEPRFHAWLFSSAEALASLAQALPEAQWNRSLAVATHPRIAQRARQLGFSRVIESQPLLDDVVACIQSIEP